ncbi:hypothetical protein [Actinocorallia sp. A-T 12471]|uniref:hypothetical protein n=1 Tax=Actinocorallia sp. A-T 12471 TaxID=3089813 RepID=UPI0029CF16A2|nr:hypothetical protein [Actinocorallia sp. A-T 12471]MDX6742135.1 hypothetical protein [Actinocorallia sp. A-T 12471]
MYTRAGAALAVATLVLAYLPLRLAWAFDDLEHYGYDPTLLDHAVVWLAAATAALYVGVTASVWLRLETAATAARVVAVPSMLCSAYTLYVAGSHTEKEGFGAASLALLGTLTLALAVIAALRLPRLDLAE